MAIKFIYFDLADTLIEKPTLYETIGSVLSGFGYSFDEKSLRLEHYRARESLIFPSETSESFFSSFNARFLDRLNITKGQLEISQKIYQECKKLSWQACPDTDILRSMNRPIGIFSNWDGTIRDKIKGLLPYNFDIILGSNELGIAKPDKKFFILAAEKAKVSPEEILYVGDSIGLDYMPAISLGIKAILIDRHGINPEFIGQRIRNLNEVFFLY